LSYRENSGNRKHRIYAVIKYLSRTSYHMATYLSIKMNILPMLLLPTTGLIRLVGSTGL
jgi:hypothetical protein